MWSSVGLMSDLIPNLIEVSTLRKSFSAGARETVALNGIDMTIRRGEYVAISGASGSGKSTLLSILGLIDSPSSGTYFFNGYNVDELSARERTRVRNQEIGFIFQEFNLIDDLTVWENVELPLSYRDGMSSTESRRRVFEALERVGMQDRIHNFPAELSGGQQQRVGVARALAGSPSLLLADEPTGSLDSAGGHLVMDLLQELNREGSTICVVTHNPQFAALASREIYLADGRIAMPRAQIVHL
jgi:putative ABC transport system ATP-binding protein